MWHKLFGTGMVQEIVSDPETNELTCYVQVQQVNVFEGSVRTTLTNLYLHKTDAYLITRIGVGMHVGFQGSIISTPTVEDENGKTLTWGGKPLMVDGVPEFHIECYDLTPLAGAAEADREDLLGFEAMGRLGRKPDTGFTREGIPYTNISLVTERVYPNEAGEWLKNPTWLRGTLWRNKAESLARMAQQGRLGKGDPLWIEGSFQTSENGDLRTWEGKDGEVNASFELNVVSWRFSPGPKATRPYTEDPGAGASRGGSSSSYDPTKDEIPF